MWTLGFRRTSLDAMAMIAPQLDTDDIAALAAYYERQVPNGVAPGGVAPKAVAQLGAASAGFAASAPK
jgi:cytochrome c553